MEIWQIAMGFTYTQKCVCAYEMYTLEISDICKKIAPRDDGSLYHVNGKGLMHVIS